MYELKLSDLRQLAKHGNATAKMGRKHAFKIAEIKKDGIYIPEQNAIVAGKKATVKIREPFHKAYAHIMTVKLGQVLLAERRNKKLVATWKFEQMLKEKKTRKQEA
ncbi:hypothetical protein SAMN02745116_00351 [Pilibacter termitis]|uniref:Uncharacterized protein n=1 Tax=Pilibacter termitis TaxID=263852 RepID=A0A1T4KRL9_9ENTE|nr:hypothetical protein [Pilibacter termitis]SJZ45089.1 hypothetical protein SAMN02745116_00351 [Pilibacter termitis]